MKLALLKMCLNRELALALLLSVALPVPVSLAGDAYLVLEVGGAIQPGHLARGELASPVFKPGAILQVSPRDEQNGRLVLPSIVNQPVDYESAPNIELIPPSKCNIQDVALLGANFSILHNRRAVSRKSVTAVSGAKHTVGMAVRIPGKGLVSGRLQCEKNGAVKLSY